MSFLIEWAQENDEPRKDSEKRAMIEPEDRQSWDALAEELGLPPEPAKGHAAPQKIARAEEGAAVPPPDVAPPEPRAAIAEMREQVELPAGPSALAGETRASAPEETAAEERRGRGRRRGRRGGRTASAESAAEPTPEVATEEAPAAEAPAECAATVESEERPRRRRRRRRKGSEREAEPRPVAEEVVAEEFAEELEPPEEALEEAPEEIEPEAEEVAEEEEEEFDDLSNLNVPSWAELIASLYRPER
jgi:hypothetical protein